MQIYKNLLAKVYKFGYNGYVLVNFTKELCMTKAEFVSQVASKAGLSKKDSTLATDAVIATITEVLASGDSVSFIGFGTFSTTKREARTARVPSTGKTINVPATRVAKFKVGKNLKEKVASTCCSKK